MGKLEDYREHVQAARSSVLDGNADAAVEHYTEAAKLADELAKTRKNRLMAAMWKANAELRRTQAEIVSGGVLVQGLLPLPRRKVVREEVAPPGR